MANRKMFSVYDSKSDTYTQPFCTINEALAVRSFTAAIQDPASEFGKFPEDFTLFYMGDFDTQTGAIVPLSTPSSITKAINIINGENL